MKHSLWFNQYGDGSGVYLAQHSHTDDRFPGWEETLGEGTWQGDYTSEGVFPNDDASYIEVPEGWRATVMQNSYKEGNQGPDDKEEVFTGPFGGKLSDYGMNDMVSEIKVEKLETPDSDEDGEEGSGGLTEEELRMLQQQQPKGPNWLLIGGLGIGALALLYFLTRKKKPATPAPAGTPPAPQTPPAS
jgi:LPXTG-motif cell wall-anchored protein